MTRRAGLGQALIGAAQPQTRPDTHYHITMPAGAAPSLTRTHGLQHAIQSCRARRPLRIPTPLISDNRQSVMRPPRSGRFVPDAPAEARDAIGWLFEVWMVCGFALPVSGALSGGRVESFPRLETMTPSLLQVLAFPASGPTGQPGCYRQTAAIIVQMAARGVAAAMRRIDGQPSSDVEVVGEQETCQFLHGERAIGNERMRAKVVSLDPACPFAVRFYI